MKTRRNDDENAVKKCTVLKRDISLDDVQKLLDDQKKNVTTNQRNGKEDAFEKALKGSKLYLHHKGLIDEK